MPQYVYPIIPGTLVVIDGDTVRADIDLGFNISRRIAVRLFGINSPEKNTAAGKEAAKFLAALTNGGLSPCRLETIKDRDDKYGGRFLGIVYKEGESPSFNDQLVLAGHAKRWDGKGVKPT